ncbi:MAG: hypothetical protein Q4A71_07415 [Actinomycetaceae bacterium]|nr:hypothetical protein [Actinomycetaceae bacterium]
MLSYVLLGLACGARTPARPSLAGSGVTPQQSSCPDNQLTDWAEANV